MKEFEKSRTIVVMAQKPFNLSTGAVLNKTLDNAAAVPQQRLAASCLNASDGNMHCSISPARLAVGC